MKKAAGIFLLLSFLNLSWGEEEKNDGYLSLSAKVQRTMDSTAPGLGVWAMPFSLEGAAQDYDIRTAIQFFPEALHITRYYSQSFGFLPKDVAHKYSLGFLEIQYVVARTEFLLFNAGFRLGHYGFAFHNFKKSSFLIHFSPVISVDLFIGKYIRINIPVEIPLALYKQRLNSFFHVRSGMEILVDPLGTIRRPVPDTIFLGLGVDFLYADWKSDYGAHTMSTWTPYFKISILY